MEKEEKIVAVLLTMAILSLGVAYVTFFQGNGEGISTDALQLTERSSVGDLVYFEGTILSKKYTFKGDHLLLSVDYGQNFVKVFIPNKNGAVDIDNMVNENDDVHIQGIVDEYQGELEVVVQSKNDIKAL